MIKLTNLNEGFKIKKISIDDCSLYATFHSTFVDATVRVSNSNGREMV